MYLFSTSTLKLAYYKNIENFGPKKPLPLYRVLNTLEPHYNDWDRQRLGMALFYQAFCRTSEIQVESEEDEQLCHFFVDSINAMFAPIEPNHRDVKTSPVTFDETLKAALVLVERIRGGHIVFDPPQA